MNLIDPPLTKFYVVWEGETFKIGDRVEVEIPAEGFSLRGRISGIVLPEGVTVHDEDGRGIGFIVSQHRVIPEDGYTIRRVN
jgi:hypothetical protein